MALLLEFVIDGPPVSHQTSDKANLRAWQAKVKKAAAAVWKKSPPLKGRLKFICLNFHEGEKPSLDDDNMVKPIRDALNKYVYLDDRQIRHSVTVQWSIDDPMRIRHATRILLDAFAGGREGVPLRADRRRRHPPTPDVNPWTSITPSTTWNGSTSAKGTRW